MTVDITLGGYQPITSLLSRTLQIAEASLSGNWEKPLALR